MRSPGLVENSGGTDVTTLSQTDPAVAAAALYGTTAGLGPPGATADMLGSVYDAAKDYQHQAYTTAHQYYNRYFFN